MPVNTLFFCFFSFCSLGMVRLIFRSNLKGSMFNFHVDVAYKANENLLYYLERSVEINKDLRLESCFQKHSAKKLEILMYTLKIFSPSLSASVFFSVTASLSLSLCTSFCVPLSCFSVIHSLLVLCCLCLTLFFYPCFSLTLSLSLHL